MVGGLLVAFHAVIKILEDTNREKNGQRKFLAHSSFLFSPMNFEILRLSPLIRKAGLLSVCVALCTAQPTTVV